MREKLKSPEDLYEWMKNNLGYGYFGKDHKIHKEEDIDFEESWNENYQLQTPSEVIKNKVGTCWDYVELERDFFKTWKIKHYTIYHQVALPYENPYPTHSFLIFKKKEKWCWFEFAWEDEKGIKEYHSIEELLKEESKKNIELLKSYGLTKEEQEKIIYRVFQKPKEHMNAEQYISDALLSDSLDTIL